MQLTIDRQPSKATNPAFNEPAEPAVIEQTAEALRERGFTVEIAADFDDARRKVLALIPEGAEVGQGASKTLEQIGVTAEIEGSGRYDAIRPRLRSMDRATQGPEIRRLGAAPEYWLGSAHAVTVHGEMVIVSFGGSQLGPIISGAGKVILAVGSQKIVPDLETGFRRIEEYSYPLESARLQDAYGIPSSINKMIILNGEVAQDRITVILIPGAIGF
ncbi:MAG TPA: LUD domain-containing protein [Candidatus Limnocylindrales bacterium]|nr:LUD domain-containing protein [Candidatus Limnocylindrales bacterium]